METWGWILGLMLLGLGSGVAWAFFNTSISKRGDALRHQDPAAARLHDAAFLQQANPAVLPMRDNAFDKPR